ncbi:MAG: SusC/RagA family TonB-linked outer membrane protein [Chitinophagaceae bacterium]
MRKILSLLTVLMLLGLMAFAQTRTVSGRVTDDKGNPISFATVNEAGTNNSVQADVNGNFTISIKKNSRLTVTAAGYQNQTMTVSGNSVTVTLAQGQNQLEEVIVTAQGIRRRPKELGYSATKVSTEELTVGRAPQIAAGISGKVSGLTIFNIDNSVDPQTKVVLRGYRSLTGSNDALIVIDGVPNTSQSVLSLINPNDIESITVLKGGQAATLYGSTGVNGALVITTKKGAAGKGKVSFNSSANFDQISFLPQFQDKYGSGSHYAASFGSPGYKTNYLDRMHDNWRPFENQQYGDPFNGEMRIVGRVLEDGSKFIIPYAPISGERRKQWNTGYTFNNQLSYSGGDAGGSYYLSVENNNTSGVVPHDRSDRTGVRFAATKEANRIRMTFSGNYIQANFDRTTSDFYFDVLNTAANIPLSDLRDWQNNKFANPNGYYDDYYNNPYFNADNNRQNYTDNNINGNFEVTYKLTSWLSALDRVGVINNSRTRKNYTGQFFYTDWAKNSAYVPAPWDYANDYDGIDRASTDIQGSVLDRISNETVINNDFNLLLGKDFGDFKNKLILGQNIYQRKTKQTEVSSGSLVQAGLYNVSNRRGELSGGENNTINRKWGYYADLTTGWRDQLFFHGSFRYDGTSVFFKPERSKNQYQYAYYGADVSYILTDGIPSLKNKIMNYAKIRAAWNRNANDNLGPYSLDLRYDLQGGFPYGNTVGYTVGDILPDKDLRPEFVTSSEVGGEFQFWNGRINLEATAYWQRSTDQILTVKVSNTTGYPNLRLNVGESKNWGYETDLRMQVIKKSKLNWELSARYSYNQNKVISLYQGVDQFAYGGYSYAQTYIINGQSFPQLKATAYVRDPASNSIVVDSASGYPILSSNLVPFGRTTPPHMVGLGTRLRVGAFALTANAEYRGGNVIFHQLGRDMTFTGSGGWTSNREPQMVPNSVYLSGGKYVPNTDRNVREAEYSYWVDYYRLIAENFVTPGWFIKLRDVNLSYSLPSNLVSRTKVLSAATISVFGRNLFTIVDKKNYYTDPEFSYTSGNGQGINNTTNTPPVRQYGVNLNLTF